MIRTRKYFAWISIAILITFIVLLSGCYSNSSNQISAEEFYKGKTITLITNSSAGGFADVVSRIIAEHIEEDTGASINFINKSNASGLEGINYAYTAEADGLTLFTSSISRMANSVVMRDPAVQYKLEDFNYILKVGHQQTHFMVDPEGTYQSINDLKSGVDLNLGSSTPSGNSALAGLSLIRLLDLDAKLVTGFSSESDRALAVKRGEVAGYFMQYLSARASIEGGMVKPLFVLSSHRESCALDVPAITELTEFNDEDMKLIDLWENSFESALIFAAPPGVSADKIEYLRSVAAKWENDPVFHEELSLGLGYDIEEILEGDEVAANMENLAMSIEEYYELFNELIKLYRD